MSIAPAEVRELSKSELVNLVADLWEARPGWRTRIVEPGEVELEIEEDTLEIVVPKMENPLHSSVDVSVDILAIQEDPYVEMEYIHVRDDEGAVINDAHLNSFKEATTGYRVAKSVIVTTGTGPGRTVDKRLFGGHRLVDGTDLCELIDQYTEYGFDYGEHF